MNSENLARAKISEASTVESPELARDLLLEANEVAGKISDDAVRRQLEARALDKIDALALPQSSS